MLTDTTTTANAFRESAKSFLTNMGGAHRIRSLRDCSPSFERDVWHAIAEAGWTSILVPEHQGGLGLGVRELLAVVEEIGRRLLPEPFVAAGVQSVALLVALPGSSLRDELLSAAMDGSKVIGVAWQEQTGTMHINEVQTSAELVDGALLLNGSKNWVAPGAGADGWLVLAEGLRLCWVEAGSSIHVDALPRVDSSSMANLRFDRAPAQCLAEGAIVLEALERANDTARFAQAAELLGIAKHVYESTLEYLKTRVQFGKPIGANQALQHRMVDAYIEVELSSACLRDVLEQYERGAQPEAALASRAKARCTDAALHLTRLAIQFHGAIGFTDEFDIGLYWKRALHLSTWLGGAAAHRGRYLQLRHDGSATDGEQCQGAVLPPDTNWTELPEATFRSAVRSFLHAHYPAHLRHAPRRVHWHEIKDWYLALSCQGWIAPAWPKEHGGMALPPDKMLAFIEEFEEFGAARMPDQGLINLGPVLIQHGTPEQQREWLPKIISGEHVWCQGYSEPNAGSDLASLRTEAVRDGDAFIVNGQKIWTTLAQDATHIFLLVRTDKTVKKQAGISFLLADLQTPGISVRPIRNIAGEEEFCEVFFDDARVPCINLVGSLNEGWGIAKALLGFERLFVGSPKTCHHALGLLRQLARQQGSFEDAAFTANMAALELDLADLQATYAVFADMVKRGDPLPPSVSLLKIFATETYTRIASKIVDIAAENGGTRLELDLDGTSVEPLAPLFTATITTIYGGSNEIQRNILARQVLGLPV